MQRTRLLAATLLCGLLLAACGDPAAQQQAKANAERLQAENTRLASELEAAKAARTQSDSTIADTARQVSDFSARMTDMTKQLESARTLATEAQAKYEQATKAVADTQAELTALRSALAKSVADANTAAEKSAQELAALRKQVADLSAQLAEASRGLNPGSIRDRLLPGSTPPASPTPTGPTGATGPTGQPPR